MKKFLLLGIILCLCIGLFASEADRSSAISVAENGYKAFLTKCLTTYARQQYGLSENDNIENAELGVPFQLMQIQPNTIRNVRSMQAVQSLVSPVTTYIFPIKFNGVIKLMMTVDKYPKASEYEIGSLGYTSLAGEIVKILKHYPREKGFNPMLCQNFQTHYYSFSLPKMGTTNLTLIRPHSSGNELYSKLGTVTQTLQFYRDRLDSFMKGGE